MGLPVIDYEGFIEAIMSASLSVILVIDNQLRVLHASRSFQPPAFVPTVCSTSSSS